MGLTFLCFFVSSYMCWIGSVLTVIYPRITDLSHPMFLYIGLVIYKEFLTVSNREIKILGSTRCSFLSIFNLKIGYFATEMQQRMGA